MIIWDYGQFFLYLSSPVVLYLTPSLGKLSKGFQTPSLFFSIQVGPLQTFPLTPFFSVKSARVELKRCLSYKKNFIKLSFIF